MAHARRGGNALRDIIVFRKDTAVQGGMREIAGLRQSAIARVSENNWFSQPRKCGQLAAGLVGLADLLLR